MNLKILAVALALLSFHSLTKLCAQSPGQLYALGVNMGILSYQLTAIQNANDLPYAKAAWAAMLSSCQSAVDAKKQVDAAAGGLFLPDGLAELCNTASKITHDDTVDSFKTDISTGIADVTKIRSDYSVQLAKGSKPDLAQAYALGVNIGIAEGQTTSGRDDARSIISDTLENAKGQAQALGLDLGSLNTLQSQSLPRKPDGTFKVSLDDLHNEAVALRASYQTLLK